MTPPTGILPKSNCLMVAAATPVTADLHPDARLLADHIRMLFGNGVDGVAVFGTTGEGTEFSVEDRTATLDALIADGIAPGQMMVSVGALAIPDTVRLAHHALDRKVDSLLLMPPCVYRGGITDGRGISAEWRALFASHAERFLIGGREALHPLRGDLDRLHQPPAQAAALGGEGDQPDPALAPSAVAVGSGSPPTSVARPAAAASPG